MNRKLKYLCLALALIAVGIACIHYTLADGIEHHSAWADAHGFPPPSRTIRYIGVGLLGGAAGWMKYALWPKQRST